MANPYQLNTKKVYIGNNVSIYIGSFNEEWFVEEDFLNNEFVEKFFSFICDQCSGDLKDYILQNKHFDLNFTTMNDLIDKLDLFSSVLLVDFAKYVDKYCECVVNEDTITYDNFSVILFNNKRGK